MNFLKKVHMKKRAVITGCLLLILCMVSGGKIASAQSINDIKVPDPGKPVCAYCGTADLGKHAPSCPYYFQPSKKTTPQKGKSNVSVPDYNAMIAVSMFQSLLSSIFSTGTDADPVYQYEALMAQQAEAQAKAQQFIALQLQKETAFKAQHNQMMQAYKQTGGSSGTAFKSLAESASGSRGTYKTLNDAELLASNAQKPFDTPSALNVFNNAVPLGKAAPFFGDTMPLADIKLLVNPENDPRVVDLREANSFVVQSIKTDKEKMDEAAKRQQAEPGKTREQCLSLGKKLDGFLAQRSRFQRTIYQGQEQLNVWEEANRAALINAAKDGVEYFAGLYLDALNRRGEAAERLQRIYTSKKSQMITDGVNVSKVEAKLNRLKTIGALAGNAAKANDWQAMMKDGISSLLTDLTSSNDEIKAMLEEPSMQKYFSTEKPELNFLLDISKMAAAEKVFGKWVAKQVPIIGLVDISIKQLYNAADWFLSFQRIAEANNINGKIMASARSLQGHIDDTYLELQQCR